MSFATRLDVIPFDKLPPQNLDCELSVIGSMFLDTGTIDEVAAIVSPDDFYRFPHQVAVRMIFEMRSRGEGIDPILVLDALEARGELPRVEVEESIRRALEVTPHAANAAFHADVVRQRSQARRLIEISDRIRREAYSNNYTSGDLIQRAESAIFALGQSRGSDRLSSLSVALDEAFDGIMRRREGEVIGLATGFPDLDQVLGGLQPGSLTVIGARPSAGKTALALNICDHSASHGRPPLLFSLEMSRSEIAARMLQAGSGIDGYFLKKPYAMRDEQWSQLDDTNARLRLVDFPIDDSPNLKIGHIASNARRCKASLDIGLVVVDYLQLVDGDDDRSNRQEQVALVSRRLKQLARELQVPVIALSQLSRGAENREDKRPRMADLRESGAIEQDADAVILLHRPDYYDPADQPGIAEVIIAKNRNGATGTIKLQFCRPLARFDSLSDTTFE